MKFLIFVAVTKAIKLGHPDVPQKPVSRDLAPDQLGWAAEHDG